MRQHIRDREYPGHCIYPPTIVSLVGFIRNYASIKQLTLHVTPSIQRQLDGDLYRNVRCQVPNVCLYMYMYNTNIVEVLLSWFTGAHQLSIVLYNEQLTALSTNNIASIIRSYLVSRASFDFLPEQTFTLRCRTAMVKQMIHPLGVITATVRETIIEAILGPLFCELFKEFYVNVDKLEVGNDETTVGVDYHGPSRSGDVTNLRFWQPEPILAEDAPVFSVISLQLHNECSKFCIRIVDIECN